MFDWIPIWRNPQQIRRETFASPSRAPAGTCGHLRTHVCMCILSNLIDYLRTIVVARLLDYSRWCSVLVCVTWHRRRVSPSAAAACARRCVRSDGGARLPTAGCMTPRTPRTIAAVIAASIMGHRSPLMLPVSPAWWEVSRLLRGVGVASSDCRISGLWAVS
jgi:hypothetical protein